MKPQAVWDHLLRAYAVSDWNAVERIASDLLYWLNHGGDPPDLTNGKMIENGWNWAVAKYACEYSLIQARNSRSRP